MDGSYLFVTTMSHHNGLSMQCHPPILLEGILQARWCTCEALTLGPQASMSQSSGNTSKCHEIPFETLNFSPRGCAPHPAETAGAAPRTPIPSPSCMRGPEGLSPPRGSRVGIQSSDTSEVSADIVPLTGISHRYAARLRRPSLADALGTPPRHHASGYVRVPQHCDSYGSTGPTGDL